MAYDNSGTLGKNKYQKNDSQPAFTGNATIGGVEYKIAGWVHQGKDGEFIGLKFSIPQPKDGISAGSFSFSNGGVGKTESAPAAATDVVDDSDIPF